MMLKSLGSAARASMLATSRSAGRRYALRLEEYIKAIGSSASGVVNPDRKDPLGAALGSIFTWQFVSKFAGHRLTEAWKAAQAEKGGLIVDDDVLKGLPRGEHIYCESDSFRFIYQLSQPHRNFDLGTFVDRVAKVYSIPRRDLLALAAESRVPSTAALTKKVMPGNVG